LQIFQDELTVLPQADNCWRENKNQWMFALCIWLIKKKLLREVRMSFLLKGHTHDDVDRLFRQIKELVKRRGAKTLAELCEIILEACINSEVDIVNYV
jgi:hypothetical protein